MSPPVITFEDMDSKLDWLEITQAIKDGHQLAKAVSDDVFLRSGDRTLLNRSAWIEGLGVAVKAATVFPHLDPSINGGVLVFGDDTGELDAILDFHLVTKWKTAADSLLGAMTLARPDAKRLLIMGAGTVARSLVDAYRAGFPDISISIWNRTAAKAAALAQELGLDHEIDLEAAIKRADIISSATMTTEPIIQGDWLQPGQHIDLIGAYRADMREVDDKALTRARIFVDSVTSTVDHIGELMDPIARGVITPQDVLADFYDLGGSKFSRKSDNDITLFKNGGGAHLDLMVCRAILAARQT